MCYSRANTLRANKNDFIASLFQLIMKLPPTGTFSYACVCESFAVIQYKSCRLTAQTIKHKTNVKIAFELLQMREENAVQNHTNVRVRITRNVQQHTNISSVHKNNKHLYKMCMWKILPTTSK